MRKFYNMYAVCCRNPSFCGSPIWYYKGCIYWRKKWTEQSYLVGDRLLILLLRRSAGWFENCVGGKWLWIREFATTCETRSPVSGFAGICGFSLNISWQLWDAHVARKTAGQARWQATRKIFGRFGIIFENTGKIRKSPWHGDFILI